LSPGLFVHIVRNGPGIRTPAIALRGRAEGQLAPGQDGAMDKRSDGQAFSPASNFLPALACVNALLGRKEAGIEVDSALEQRA